MTLCTLNTNRINRLFLVIVLLIWSFYSHSLHAFDDDREQISKQMDRHERAVKSCMVGFRDGDLNRQQNAQVEIAATEAYLSVLNFPANDTRLTGHLFDEAMAESSSNVSEFSSSLFHYRVRQRSSFAISYDELLHPDVLADARVK